jgi:hypothetical protein
LEKKPVVREYATRPTTAAGRPNPARRPRTYTPRPAKATCSAWRDAATWTSYPISPARPTGTYQELFWIEATAG